MSGEVECKWSGFLGEVGCSHRPMLGLGYAVAKQVFFLMFAPGAEPYESYHQQWCVTFAKILKFAAGIYKIRDLLQGMAGLVIFLPINFGCKYSFMVSP